MIHAWLESPFEMKRRIIIAYFLCGFGLFSCDECEDDTKLFQAELYPTIRSSFYDWRNVNHVSGDTIYFGVGTEFMVCWTRGQEELASDPIEFFTYREIVFDSDTIQPLVNLLNDPRVKDYMVFYKETDAFFNSPQYLIRVDNKSLKLKDYYTFYFKGYSVSGAEINDSTIVYVE